MRIISAADIDRAIDMPVAIAAMERAFSQLSDGSARVPPRIHLETDGGLLLAMPGFLPREQALATKIVTVFPDNRNLNLPSIFGLVVVLDAATGQPQALIEGGRLTAIRTGAASALATRYLARTNARTVTVFGAGIQARTQLDGVRAVRDIRCVRIVSRRRSAAESLAAELDGMDVTVMDDAAAAIDGADIIVTATTSSTPLFHGEAIRPGTHINAVGSYAPTMRELDTRTLQRGRLYVDTRDAALREAGELLLAIAEGQITAHSILGELGELVRGAVSGRLADTDITIFKSVGNAAQDVALAKAIFDVAESRSLGTVVTL